MIRLNVDETLKRAEIERKKPKPLPKVRVIAKNSPHKKSSPKKLMPTVIEPDLSTPKSDLVAGLWVEFNQLKVERNKLSSQTWRLVKGASQSELSGHYHKIEGYRPQLQAIFDKIKYVEVHGELPGAPPEMPAPTEDLFHLKFVKKKSLINVRSKLKRKLEKSAKPKNPERVLEWEVQLAQLDIEYAALCNRIKEMEGKA